MRKTTTNIIIVFMAIVATTMAVASCKKDIQNTPRSITKSVEDFDPRHIEDMNDYLMDFKQRMLTATKGDDELLSVEDAAWHLSSMANFAFANANVEFNDIRFDTLYSHVIITNGKILLSDLRSTYEAISTNIDKFYQSLALDNKHFRFIEVSISENGEVSIPITTTFSCNSKYLIDNCWYYEDDFSANSVCYEYFTSNTYPVQTTGTTELQRVLNLLISQPTVGNGIVYYTLSSSKEFHYRDYIDPYGSPAYMNSRLFANNTVFNYDIVNDICYYLDSYLGLGVEYCPTNEYILNWAIQYVCCEEPYTWEHLYKEHQRLKVNYGIRHTIPSHPGQGDD